MPVIYTLYNYYIHFKINQDAKRLTYWIFLTVKRLLNLLYIIKVCYDFFQKKSDFEAHFYGRANNIGYHLCTF